MHTLTALVVTSFILFGLVVYLLIVLIMSEIEKAGLEREIDVLRERLEPERNPLSYF